MAKKTVSTKPETPYDHRVETADKHHVDIHQSGGTVSAFLNFPEHGRYGANEPPSLSLISQYAGSDVINYVGYRDGKTQNDKVAVSVDHAGDVTVQVVMSEETGRHFDDVRIITLAKLEQLIRDDPNPDPV